MHIQCLGSQSISNYHEFIDINAPTKHRVDIKIPMNGILNQYLFAKAR